MSRTTQPQPPILMGRQEAGKPAQLIPEAIRRDGILEKAERNG
jgi:hypothetical protein